VDVIALAPSAGSSVELPNGHHIRFLQVTAGAAFSVLEWTAAPGMAGSAVHVHRRTDEAFYVVDGAYGFLVDDNTIEATRGAYVLVPRGVVHAFWNPGNVPATMVMVISPAGFEAYFRELSDGLAAAGESADAALAVRQELAGRHDIEVLGPPMVHVA
jgi:mannose-6-phosphate isomerase-like protein (cupin superfamily)